MEKTWRSKIKRLLSMWMVMLLIACSITVTITPPVVAEAATVKAKSVKLNYEAYTLKKGKTVKLKATVSPTNAKNKTIVWTTSKKSVATVSSKGVVKGMKKGTATITATVKGTKIKATCKISVGTPVTKVTVKSSKVTVKVGSTATIKTTVSPSSATNKGVSYTSSNKKVVTVSSSGKITGKKAGTATILVKAKDGSGKKATVKVTVKNIEVTSVKLNADKSSITVGQSAKVTATVSPSKATVKTLTWTSSDDTIATVDKSGNVKGIKPGTVTITATSNNKKTGTIKITVNPVSVTGVSVSPANATIKIGAAQQLTATVSPSDATNKGVTWSSSNTNVAAVDANGKVTAKAVGTATITVTTNDGSKTAKATITVPKTDVTGVTVKADKNEVLIGGSVKVTATVSPDNATNKTVTWSSSNTAVAIVDKNGTVTAVAAGTVKITATADGKSGSVEITVKPIAVTGVSVSPTTASLKTGDTQQLTATVSPANATNKTVTWSSSNTNVATVDTNGKVTAVAAGTATITVSTKDGNKTATATITVSVPKVDVTSVSISPKGVVLNPEETQQLTATVLPENASNQNVSWTSSDTDIATVDENGKVTAVAIGTATITATTEDGKKTAEAVITVFDEELLPDYGSYLIEDDRTDGFETIKLITTDEGTPKIRLTGYESELNYWNSLEFEPDYEYEGIISYIVTTENDEHYLSIIKTVEEENVVLATFPLIYERYISIILSESSFTNADKSESYQFEGCWYYDSGLELDLVGELKSLETLDITYDEKQIGEYTSNDGSLETYSGKVDVSYGTQRETYLVKYNQYFDIDLTEILKDDEAFTKPISTWEYDEENEVSYTIWKVNGTAETLDGVTCTFNDNDRNYKITDVTISPDKGMFWNYVIQYTYRGEEQTIYLDYQNSILPTEGTYEEESCGEPAGIRNIILLDEETVLLTGYSESLTDSEWESLVFTSSESGFTYKVIKSEESEEYKLSVQWGDEKEKTYSLIYQKDIEDIVWGISLYNSTDPIDDDNWQLQNAYDEEKNQYKVLTVKTETPIESLKADFWYSEASAIYTSLDDSDKFIGKLTISYGKQECVLWVQNEELVKTVHMTEISETGNILGDIKDFKESETEEYIIYEVSGYNVTLNTDNVTCNFDSELVSEYKISEDEGEFWNYKIELQYKGATQYLYVQYTQDEDMNLLPRIGIIYDEDEDDGYWICVNSIEKIGTQVRFMGWDSKLTDDNWNNLSFKSNYSGIDYRVKEEQGEHYIVLTAGGEEIATYSVFYEKDITWMYFEVKDGDDIGSGSFEYTEDDECIFRVQGENERLTNPEIYPEDEEYKDDVKVKYDSENETITVQYGTQERTCRIEYEQKLRIVELRDMSEEGNELLCTSLGTIYENGVECAFRIYEGCNESLSPENIKCTFDVELDDDAYTIEPFDGEEWNYRITLEYKGQTQYIYIRYTQNPDLDDTDD